MDYLRLVIAYLLIASLQIEAARVSVSGVSSGGFAAVQFHVSYSSSIMGSGIIAAGPFYCANADVEIALSSCMKDPQDIIISELVLATDNAALIDSVDNPSHMSSHKVWLFSGTKDTVVNPGVVKKLQEYYGNYVIADNIKTVYNISAEHSFVTKSYGNACDYLGEPYLNNCGYDSAGALLQHIYGTLNPPVRNYTASNFVELDQASFISIFSPKEVGLWNKAYAYVPSKCQSGNADCDLHISFHGCLQTIPNIGNLYYTKTGLNEWAESNNIIILYPQAQANDLNPKGCFDWWGYTGPEYACKLGPQMSTVKGMMDYLLRKFTRSSRTVVPINNN